MSSLKEFRCEICGDRQRESESLVCDRVHGSEARGHQMGFDRRHEPNGSAFLRRSPRRNLYQSLV